MGLAGRKVTARPGGRSSRPRRPGCVVVSRQHSLTRNNHLLTSWVGPTPSFIHESLPGPGGDGPRIEDPDRARNRLFRTVHSSTLTVSEGPMSHWTGEIFRAAKGDRRSCRWGESP